jgi:hypothetical protein
VYLESLGYDAVKLEFNGLVGQQYVKRDVWGADLAYKNNDVIGFVQVKTSEAQIAKGKRQLCGRWPKLVRREVYYWPTRGKEPMIYVICD